MVKFLLGIALCIHANFLLAQVSVLSANREMVNYGTIDLSTATSWSTTMLPLPSKFSNYGAAGFRNAGAAFTLTTSTGRWVSGYVKHYCTTGNTSHFYPVGSTTARMFLSTTSEKVGSEISVAWLNRNPGIVPDPTNSNQYHPVTSVTAPIVTVSTQGQWDWYTSVYSGTVNVSVNLPSTLTGGIISNTNLRLVGWNGSSWVNLGIAGSTATGTLTGAVPSSIQALGIGNLTAVSNFRTAQPEANIDATAGYFNIYPNPVEESGVINLEYLLAYSGNAFIVINDINGKEVLRQNVVVLEGINRQIITINALAAGIYVISLFNTGNTPVIESKNIIIK